jgi:hypothetical protein
MSEHREAHAPAGDLARATDLGADIAALDATAGALARPVREALAELASRAGDLDEEDGRAVAAMRASLAASGEASTLVTPVTPPGGCTDARAWAAALAEGGEVLRKRPHACFGATASRLRVGGETLGRLQILARLGRAPDAAVRRPLFLALEPLWRVVDGDGITTSPCRVVMREAAESG